MWEHQRLNTNLNSSQEQVAESSEGCYAVTLALELVRSRSTQGKFFWLDSGTDCCQNSQYGMTSQHSEVTTQSAPNTSVSSEASKINSSSREGSRVQTSLQLEQTQKEKLLTDLMEKAQAFGLNSCELLKRCDLRPRLGKTQETSELKDLCKYSKGLMSWGIMQDGVYLNLDLSAQITTAPECGYLPTPTSHNSKEGAYPAEFTRNTPTLSAQVGGKVNPPWNEWRMGWLINHTDLKPLEMGKIQEWFALHGIFLAEENK